MTPLERRVRANCCPYHGLTRAEFDRHVRGIVRMIERARVVHSHQRRNPQ